MAVTDLWSKKHHLIILKHAKIRHKRVKSSINLSKFNFINQNKKYIPVKALSKNSINSKHIKHNHRRTKSGKITPYMLKKLKRIPSAYINHKKLKSSIEDKENKSPNLIDLAQ